MVYRTNQKHRQYVVYRVGMPATGVGMLWEKHVEQGVKVPLGINVEERVLDAAGVDKAVGFEEHVCVRPPPATH